MLFYLIVSFSDGNNFEWKLYYDNFMRVDLAVVASSGEKRRNKKRDEFSRKLKVAIRLEVGVLSRFTTTFE